MKWKFWQRERQDNSPAQTQNLNQLLSEFLLSEAQGPVRRADFEATLAFEAAVGILQRCMATAKVEGTNYLKPCVLAAMVRDIALRGETVWWLSPMTYRVGYYDLDGKFDRESWRYKLYLPGPSDTMVKAENQTYKNCLHVIYQSHPLRPWRGISPLAKTFGQQALANLEKSLGEEAGTATAQVLPLPSEGIQGDNAEKLKTALLNARGKLRVVETTADNWGTGDRKEAPKQDWGSKRLGPMIPDASIKAHESISKQVFSALGVPISLSGMDTTQGAAIQQSLKQLVYGTLTGIGLIIAESWEYSTGQKISFNFDRLHSNDILNKTKAFNNLIKGGMPIDQAAIKSGLLESED